MLLLKNGANPNTRTVKKTSIVSLGYLASARAYAEGNTTQYLAVLACLSRVIDAGGKAVVTSYDEYSVRTNVTFFSQQPSPKFDRPKEVLVVCNEEVVAESSDQRISNNSSYGTARLSDCPAIDPGMDSSTTPDVEITAESSLLNNQPATSSFGLLGPISSLHNADSSGFGNFATQLLENRVFEPRHIIHGGSRIVSTSTFDPNPAMPTTSMKHFAVANGSFVTMGGADHYSIGLGGAVLPYISPPLNSMSTGNPSLDTFLHSQVDHTHHEPFSSFQEPYLTFPAFEVGPLYDSYNRQFQNIHMLDWFELDDPTWCNTQTAGHISGYAAQIGPICDDHSNLSPNIGMLDWCVLENPHLPQDLKIDQDLKL